MPNDQCLEKIKFLLKTSKSVLVLSLINRLPQAHQNTSVKFKIRSVNKIRKNTSVQFKIGSVNKMRHTKIIFKNMQSYNCAV